jgi:PAS domain S-box-containing protein
LPHNRRTWIADKDKVVAPQLADFGAFLGLLPSPALVLDRAGRIAAANLPMARCLALAPDDLAGRELAEWAGDVPALQAFLAGETASPAEFRFRGADGSERHLALSIARDALAASVVVSVVDMTAFRAVEQKLQKNVERFRDMVGAGSGWFYEVDSTLSRIRLFRRGKENGALAMMELDAKWPDDVIDTSYDPEGFAVVYRRWQAREPSRDVIHRVPQRDGKEVFAISSSIPFYDGHGTYQGRRGVSVDVTAQVMAERALRESEARLRRSQEHLERAQRIAAMGSSECDFATDAEEWSPETYRIFGVDPAAFIPTQENILGLIHEEDRGRVMKAMARSRAGLGVPRGEIRIVRPDGGVRTVQCETDVLFDDAGNPIRHLTVFKDVTELRAAERREKEMQQHLLHSQKLESLGTLAGGIAHELNNTLVPVLALAKLTARRLPEHSRERSNLETILQASERARDLVGRILAFSRKEAVTRREVDVAELARTALKLLRASMPSTIKLAERIVAVPPVMGDADQLLQVMINLVANAGQAIGNGFGTITIEVAPAARLPHEPDRSPGAGICLSVSDTGCGMDEATAARLFEPFFTTKAVGEGTGLGLSVVHGIVTQHGGTIAVESRVAEGTRFAVYLPAAAAAPAPAATQIPASAL